MERVNEGESLFIGLIGLLSPLLCAGPVQGMYVVNMGEVLCAS